MAPTRTRLARRCAAESGWNRFAFAIVPLLLLFPGFHVLAPATAADVSSILIVAPHPDDDVIYGAGIAADVARRWKTQINENGKAWAFYEVFPELNHNATVGFPLPAEIAKKIRVIMLRSPLFNERIKLRYEVTGELLIQAGVTFEYVDSAGESPLAQMVSLVSIGDYVSYYLALLYRVDPSPVKVIDYLKQRLA